MAPSIQSLMKEGIDAHAARDHAKAASLFAQALRHNRNNESAWLWLSTTLTNPGEQRYCYEQALAARPTSQVVQAKLAALSGVSAVVPSVLASALPTSSPVKYPLDKIIIPVCILVSGLFVLFYFYNAQYPAPPRSPDATDAWVDCKSFVQQNLKAPATAVFPASNAPGVAVAHLESKGRWGVLGYVDSQNSFGAMLRSGFTCEVSYSGNQVTLHQLQIGDQTLIDN
jgi:hypothetical protein